MSDDPSADDRDWIVGDLITQLIDMGKVDGLSREERRVALTKHRHESEARFAEAQKRLGPDRLQHYYFEAAGSKYVGGYLAVRSVVAAWRATAGPMSGHAAMRHLLHVTRYATFDLAVPNLGLPPAEFEAAAQGAMLSWVRGVAAIDPVDLRFAEEAERPFRWEAFRPVKGHADKTAVDELETLFIRRVDEAMRPVAAIGRPSRLYVAQDLLDAWVRVLSVMPLGRATAKFWLNRGTQHLVYVVRVVEQRQDTGEASYDLGTVPLEATELARLEAAMTQYPFDRLTLTRLADLAEGVSGRQGGMNVIAFQLGDWIHIQPRGWAFGSTAVDPGLESCIQVRLAPPSHVRMEAALLQGPSGAAARTAAWLDEGVVSGDDESGPWLAEVGAHARGVRDHDGSARERSASRQLVELVTGDFKVAEALIDKGLRALVSHDMIMRRAAYGVLQASGSTPSPAAALNLDEDHPLRQLLRCGTHGWDVVPVAPRSNRSEEPQ